MGDFQEKPLDRGDTPEGDSTRLYGVVLSIVISLIAIGAAATTYVIGRNASRDVFVEKVAALVAAETQLTSLYDAYEAAGKRLADEPLTSAALRKIYDVPAGDLPGLVARLHTIAWFPPYRPAPFVGHIARPMLGTEPHINLLGFRDERQSYITKSARTVRVFVTGASNAWGSGATSQKNTVPSLLEQMLNDEMSPTTGYRYEVVNAAFPAWSTTQEKILIEQRLVDMGPDAIVMFSGNGDVHWSSIGRDIRWFNNVPDQNYLALLDELYKQIGHPEWAFSYPRASAAMPCPLLGRIARRNVETATSASARVNARLVFALIPNIVSTAKSLTAHELQILGTQNRPYWNACFQAMREELSAIDAANYRFVDLSKLFGDLDATTEVFMDAYHVADFGNRRMAETLLKEIDWRSIAPNAMPAPAAEPLKVFDMAPREWKSGKPFEAQADGNSGLRVFPNRMNENLLVIFDETILHTTIAGNSLVASLPLARYGAPGEHRVVIADRVSGETSEPVVFRAQ
jgi:hypothetical protein